jgi:putative ABC transport system permease protein
MIDINVKLAFQSLRRSKWRSFLTMLGVIIGVVSVVVTVSVGIGIRRQITGQINQLGPDLITIIPGQNDQSSGDNLIRSLNLLPTLGSGAFDQKDLNLIASTKNVKVAVPLSLVTGTASVGNTQYNGQVIATTDGLPSVFNQQIQYGQFFSANDISDNVAVIGENVATQLFHDNSPIGESFNLRGQSFTVMGVFGQFDTSPLTPIANYNNDIFVPFDIGSQLTGGNPQIYEIFAKPYSIGQTNQVAQSIENNLSNSEGGQTNFSVLEQKQNLAIANSTLTLLTSLVAGVTAISLFVGGIGIMNIMLVSVIERTKEIGIRKAIGATNRQIRNQFLTESAAIGFMGGVIGVIVSFVVDEVLALFTTLRPAMTFEIVFLAICVGLFAGIIFGLMPAIRASRRDPIDSIRHD